MYRNVVALDLAALDLTERIGFHLPDAVYSCKTLEVLKLQGQFLVSLSDVVVCLPKLSVLELIEVGYESDESLPKLMSGCPVLRDLRIESHQPILRIEVMKLLENSMRAIAKATNPLSANFERLNSLVIRFDSRRWKCLVDVIECCVQLQTLDVQYCGESDGIYWIDPVCVPRCMSSSLKTLALRSFDGLEAEMALLKFILHHGAKMETVYLWYCEYDPSDSKRRHEILNRVLKLPKESPVCKIVEWRPSVGRRLTM